MLFCENLGSVDIELLITMAALFYKRDEFDPFITVDGICLAMGGLPEKSLCPLYELGLVIMVDLLTETTSLFHKPPFGELGGNFSVMANFWAAGVIKFASSSSSP